MEQKRSCKAETCSAGQETPRSSCVLKPYPEPVESSPQRHILIKINFNIISHHVRLDIRNILFYSGLRT
jgi:hypothetical protein